MIIGLNHSVFSGHSFFSLQFSVDPRRLEPSLVISLFPFSLSPRVSCRAHTDGEASVLKHVQMRWAMRAHDIFSRSPCSFPRCPACRRTDPSGPYTVRMTRYGVSCLRRSLSRFVTKTPHPATVPRPDEVFKNHISFHQRSGFIGPLGRLH